MPNSHRTLARPTDTPSPTFVSLYSGAGGLDLGFARAGFTPVFANDIDRHAVNTYNKLREVQDPEWLDTAQRFANHEAICGDVRNVGQNLEAGMADVVIGGPPCQGFSVAGRMDPEDPRSRHVFDFLGLVARIRPRAFVMENVAALGRNKRWRDVIAQLQEMAAMDYKVELFVLNASHWGVPQARERMFLIGVPTDSELPNLDGGWTRDTPPTVRNTLQSLPPAGAVGNDSLCTAIITPAKRPVLRKSPFAGMLFNGQGRPMNLDKPAPTLPATMGGNRTPIIDMSDLATGAKPWVVGYHEQLVAEKIEPLVALPPDAHLRRISVQEAAALQTFPRDVQWQGTQSAQFRQIGNAVPPLLGFAVAQALRTALLSHPAA